MVEIPPDPRKNRPTTASKAGAKPEPRREPGAGKPTAAQDHVAGSGKVIEERRGAPEGSFGNPPHEPTDANRETVKKMASFGNKHEEIALILGISEDTLTKYYAYELKMGGVELNNQIADKMATRALSDDHKDAQRAAEYWLSRRAGWKETSTHEHTGAGGGPIETRQLPATDDWLAQFAGSGAKASSPASGED